MVIIGTVFIEDLDNKEKLAEVVSESNILVNATRAGMAPLENVIPVPEERLRPELAVADVVYNLLETLLVKKEKFSHKNKRKVIVITLRQAIVTTACLNYEKFYFLYNYLIHKHH